MYHDPQRPTPDILDEASADNLQQYQGKNGDANAVVGVRQASFRPYGEPSEDEEYRRQENGEDQEVGVISDRIARVSRIESRVQDSYGDEEKKDDCCEKAVCQYEGVVLCDGREAIAHA